MTWLSERCSSKPHRRTLNTLHPFCSNPAYLDQPPPVYCVWAEQTNRVRTQATPWHAGTIVAYLCLKAVGTHNRSCNSINKCDDKKQLSWNTQATACKFSQRKNERSRTSSTCTPTVISSSMQVYSVIWITHGQEFKPTNCTWHRDYNSDLDYFSE